MLDISDKSMLEDFKKSETQHLSPRKALDKMWTIYRSHALRKPKNRNIRSVLTPTASCFSYRVGTEIINITVSLHPGQWVSSEHSIIPATTLAYVATRLKGRDKELSGCLTAGELLVGLWLNEER